MESEFDRPYDDRGSKCEKRIFILQHVAIDLRFRFSPMQARRISSLA